MNKLKKNPKHFKCQIIASCLPFLSVPSILQDITCLSLSIYIKKRKSRIFGEVSIFFNLTKNKQINKQKK